MLLLRADRDLMHFNIEHIFIYIIPCSKNNRGEIWGLWVQTCQLSSTRVQISWNLYWGTSTVIYRKNALSCVFLNPGIHLILESMSSYLKKALSHLGFVTKQNEICILTVIILYLGTIIILENTFYKTFYNIYGSLNLLFFSLICA